MSTIQKYRELYKANPGGGGLSEYNSALWDCLLHFQAENGVAGNLFEIGVWYGFASSMFALHLKADEKMIVVDKYMEPQKFAPTLESLVPGVSGRLEFTLSDSVKLARKGGLPAFRDSVRFAHVDGEHSYEAVFSDLELAWPLIVDRGVIVVDDFFFSECPMISQAVFDFVRINPGKMCIFMCGFNKAYLCSPRDLQFYREFAISLPHKLDAYGVGVRACFSGWAHENPIVGLVSREDDNRYLFIGHYEKDARQSYDWLERGAGAGVSKTE